MTAGKIGADAIDTALLLTQNLSKQWLGTKIADNAIATSHITDLHVTEAKLAANAVTPGVFER